MTMKHLAARCKEAGVRVSVSEISRIERRIHGPRPVLRKTLADLLGVTVADFGEPGTGTDA